MILKTLKRPENWWLALMILPVLVALNISCSLERYGGTPLSVQIDATQAILDYQRANGGDVHGENAATGIYNFNFNCYAVNVMGAGINSHSQNGNDNPNVILANIETQSCAYPGITSRPIPRSGPFSASLTVPMGSDRWIQVLGVMDPSGIYCNANIPIGDVNTNQPAMFYEIAKTRVNLFASGSFQLNNTFPGNTANDPVVAKLDRAANCQSSTLGTLVSESPTSGNARGPSIWAEAGQLGTASVTTNTHFAVNYPTDLVQMTYGNYPTQYNYSPTGLNGVAPAIAYGGSTTHTSATIDVSTWSAKRTLTVFAVGALPATGNLLKLFNSSGYPYLEITGSGGLPVVNVCPSNTTCTANLITATATPNGSVGITTPSLFHVVWSDSQGKVGFAWRPTGVNEIYGEASGASFGANTPITTLAVMNGTFSEVLVYPRALTPKETDTIKSYLRTKYNILAP